MLAVLSPLMSADIGGHEEEILLDDINFDDILVGFDDGDILPDLEIDPDDIFADFSFSSGEEETNSGNTVAVVNSTVPVVPGSCEEVVSERRSSEESVDDKKSSSHSSSGRKSSAAKASHGKKKAKVDWTPELHRRFVQAVEQLGVDKAVPSRILELMGIDCLTRHNIASHLQKYRSHRKHLLAREAEAASWSQRRQMYAAAGGMMKKTPGWQAAVPAPISPAGIFPPPPPPPHQMIRPLHVWGHPSDRPQLVPVWPRHLTPPPPWLPSRPDHASYWHPHYQRTVLTQGMPCFPPQLVPAAPTRFQAGTVAVPGIPPAAAASHPLSTYRAVPANSAAASSTSTAHVHMGKNSTTAGFDAHLSNENIDAAIGDVLAKPWTPLPLGLKPPSLESVMVELQRQGVSKVPPSSSSTAG